MRVWLGLPRGLRLLTITVLGWCCLQFANAQSFVPGPFLAWSPDGTMLAVAHETTVQVIDAETMIILNTIIDVAVRNNGSAWSPDGTMLAVIDGVDVQIWLQPWDPMLAERMVTLQYYTDWSPAQSPRSGVVHVTWSPDSMRVAAASGDFTFIWNVSTEQLEYELLGSWATVYSVVWTPDNRLAVMSMDGIIAILNPDTGEEINYFYHRSSGFPIALTALSFSPNGDRAAIGDADGAMFIWEDTRTAELWTYFARPLGTVATIHNGHVRTLVWHPDGQYLASGGGWDGAHLGS